MAALAEGRAQAQSRADARGHPCVRARRPVRQHRPRLQLRHGDAHGAEAAATTAITEAGFGADLGAEKFLDIKCRLAGLKPDCGGRRGHGARAQEPRRRGARPTSTRRTWRRWRRACRTCCSTWRTSRNVYKLPVRRGHQRLPDRHRGRARARRGQVPRAGRERRAVRGLG